MNQFLTMSHHIIQPFGSMNDHNPIAELLEMIERKAPLFMKAHLGISNIKEWKPMTKRKLAGIRQQVAMTAGIRDETRRKQEFDRIAKEHAVHYSTVIKHTGDIRHAALAGGGK
jgi:hypothetical protein